MKLNINRKCSCCGAHIGDIDVDFNGYREGIFYYTHNDCGSTMVKKTETFNKVLKARKILKNLDEIFKKAS